MSEKVCTSAMHGCAFFQQADNAAGDEARHACSFTCHASSLLHSFLVHQHMSSQVVITRFALLCLRESNAFAGCDSMQTDLQVHLNQSCITQAVLHSQFSSQRTRPSIRPGSFCSVVLQACLAVGTSLVMSWVCHWSMLRQLTRMGSDQAVAISLS